MLVRKGNRKARRSLIKTSLRPKTKTKKQPMSMSDPAVRGFFGVPPQPPQPDPDDAGS